jgi:hypothetical protein
MFPVREVTGEVVPKGTSIATAAARLTFGRRVVAGNPCVLLHAASDRRAGITAWLLVAHLSVAAAVGLPLVLLTAVPAGLFRRAPVQR